MTRVLGNMEDIIEEFEKAVDTNACCVSAKDLVELAKLILENKQTRNTH